MKKYIALIFVLLLFTDPVLADHRVGPFFTEGDSQCSWWGYTNVLFGTKIDPIASHARGRVFCQQGRWSALFEGDLAGLDRRIPPNYLVQGWVAYEFDGSGTKVKVGRFQIAASFASPTPWNGPTVEAAHADPFTMLGTGAQVETWITPQLRFVADITNGTSVPLFSDSRNWERVETSQILQWSAVTEKERTILLLSFSNQSGDGMQRNGITVSYHPTHDLAFDFGAYRNDERIPGFSRERWIGGFLFGDYRAYQFDLAGHPLDFHVHAMVDGTAGTTDYKGVTTGLSLVLPPHSGYGRLSDSSATLDFTASQLNVNGGPPIEDKNVMLRLRVFF